ncbi:hypothetical protein [Defluviitalea phaphyphila]|uniref:hypothetical protein n=1 Tax=Defluviitalea phaphyphila TaxID=1473580 RepID=UPI00073025AE|nr:hypothetical protein [Defluviitalea phaphyphila]
MDEKIKKLILDGNFDEAQKIAKSFDIGYIRELLIDLCYETENIIVYSFVYNMLCKEESSELHYIASELLSMPLCHVTGAYNSALFHARRAIELDPNNISYKEYILLFYNLPERLISEYEAKKIAQEVIEKMPNSKAALDILNIK